MTKFDEKYKGVTIKGSEFPDAPINEDVRINFSKEMLNEYIPLINILFKNQPRGFKLLLIIMTNKEGFLHGSRSYRTKNPGNIGNTDSGKAFQCESLKDGIMLQKEYTLKIVEGRSKTYPMGKRRKIDPSYSPEIAKHPQTYQMSPWLPGYDFVFTGQLDQFVKIYSTGARGGNSYLSQIISFFKNHGIAITPQSKLQDIIQIV